MNGLQITPLAKNDLQEIQAYITDELQNPTAALNIIKQITKKLRSLVDFSTMGTSLSSIVDIETVYVIRILYGRGDFMKILFGGLSDDVE